MSGYEKQRESGFKGRRHLESEQWAIRFIIPPLFG